MQEIKRYANEIHNAGNWFSKHVILNAAFAQLLRVQEFTPRDLEFSPQVAECDMVLYTVGTHNEKQAFAEFF